MIFFNKVNTDITKTEFLKLNDCFLRSISIAFNFLLNSLKSIFKSNTDITFNKLSKLFNNNLIIHEFNFLKIKDFNFTDAYFDKFVIVSIFPSKAEFEILLKYKNNFNSEFLNIWNKFSYDELFKYLQNDKINNSFHWIAVKNNNYFDYFNYNDFGVNINNWYILNIVSIKSH